MKVERYVYDEIGRPYPRKNRYLAELAELDAELETADPKRAKELKAKRSELEKNKSSHPHIVKLKEARKAEREFLAELKRESAAYKKSLSRASVQVVKWRLEYFQAEKKAAFYEPLVDLDYDFELAYKAAETQIHRLPLMLETRAALEAKEGRLKAELEAAKGQDHSSAEAKIKAYKEERQAQADAEIKQIKQLQKQGQISARAYRNEREQKIRAAKEDIRAREMTHPLKTLKSQLENVRHHLRVDPESERRVLNSDLSDLRRRIPVETFQQRAYKSWLALLVPGLGQVLNKQYVKSIFFFLLTFIIYFINLPYAMGKHNYRGEGLAGLINLAAGRSRVDRSIIFMIEGILAVCLLIIAIFLFYFSFRDAHRVEKNKIKGTRPYNWFETKNSISRNGFPYMVSLPALILIIFIVMVPIFSTVLISFTNYDPSHQSKFVWSGITNYREIFLGQGVAGGPFWKILGWTVIWTLGASSLAIFIGFFLSLIAHQERIKGKRIFRTIYLLPWAVPAFITIMMFSVMFSPGGPLAEILESLLGYPFNVKNDTYATRVVLILLQGWLGSAYVFMLSTGVLQGIPGDLYEAAHIDGATAFQQAFKITIPLVLYRTAPLLIGQYTFNFNNFSIIHLFNGGGPFNPSRYGNIAGSTDILISYIYKLTIVKQYQAIGAAITIVISIFLLIITWYGYRNSKAFKEN
ncbi:MAG: ABC transporter permease subunit [Eubacteriales bacterium]|nr:ABC transporter permease subunit [Eubacteriales bacterium]